jgi:hypothetical protein
MAGGSGTIGTIGEQALKVPGIGRAKRITDSGRSALQMTDDT